MRKIVTPSDEGSERRARSGAWEHPSYNSQQRITHAEAISLYDGLAGGIRVIALRVRRRAPAGIALEDLEQAGAAALWAACGRFDPARRATFPTYARMRICGAMLDAIGGPEYREAARERDAVRIDAPADIDCPQSISGFIDRRQSIAHPDPFVARAVARLGGRRPAIMALRFYTGLTRAEVGARLGLSPQAVGRSERASIRTLRALLGRAA